MNNNSHNNSYNASNPSHESSIPPNNGYLNDTSTQRQSTAVTHAQQNSGVVGAAGIANTNYSTAYNTQGNAANNAQYQAAPAAPMQAAYGVQQPGTNMSQPTNTSYAQPSPSRQQPQNNMYARPTAVATTAGMGASPAPNVPNPLGLGVGQQAAGGAVGGGLAPSSTSNGSGGPSKTDLLRQMYQSRQRPAQESAAAAQLSQQGQVIQQGQGVQQGQAYRSSGIHHQVQPQQTQVQPPNNAAYTTNATTQNNIQQQQYRSNPIQAAPQMPQNNNVQQPGYQSSQQNSSQSQPNSSGQQQQQVYQSSQMQSSQPSSQQVQQSHSSSSQRPGDQQQMQKKKFHLTPEAKVALREAVLSAIRHPQGTVDPTFLKRAMALGLPEKAILNAAVVARQRDATNRSQRHAQSRSQQNVQNSSSSQQQGGQSGQTMQPQGGQQRQQQHVQGQIHQSQQQQRSISQNQQHHQQRQQHPQQVQPPAYSNTNPSAKAQMQQQMYQQSPQRTNQQLTAAQYNQQQYQQQQQQQQQAEQQRRLAEEQRKERQAQYDQQQQLRQQQFNAQQANLANQRKAQEEARKKQLQQQFQAEQQRLLAEEQRKKKEMEAAKAAAEERQRHNQQLVGRMKGWGRTEYGLIVKSRAKGLPQQRSEGLLRQSTWGGASLSLDRDAALIGALKRSSREAKSDGGEDGSQPKHNPRFQNAIDVIRNQLLKQPQPMLKENAEPTTEEEERRRRTATISSKVYDLKQCTQYKRLKLQPKRETRFLDKHIRRARQITADGLKKGHKELLRAIVTHQSEFYKFHRLKKNECSKIARVIRDQHRKKELAKEKETDNTEKARLAALRANDMAAYTSLLEDTKNERLKFLLDKTDECMNQISTLLASRAAEEEEDIKQMGGEGTVKATFSSKQEVKTGSYYETAHVKSESVRQPSLLTGGDLKEYQLGGLQWMVSLYNNRLNGILADEMGLGKTIQTIALLAYLIEMKQNLGPYLVIVPLSTLSNWVNEFSKWLPAATVICYKGSPQQRKALFRDEVADGHFNVLLTTYEFVIRDKASLRKLAWQYAIVDEGHRMKNNQSKFSVTLGTQYNTRRRILLTGTPMQNNLPELWALLNFLLPEVFNSAESFDQWFNKPFSSFGKTGNDTEDSSNELISNEERMLIIHRLHELLRPFMLRRVKSEVLDQLPQKVEKVIRCELSAWQKELYKQISVKIADEATKSNFSRGLNNVVMQLRKVCNHPFLFNNEGYHINEDIIRTSGKVELLDRMLPKLKAAGHRVLMFTQMTKMMPILEDYFAFRGFSSLRLDGSTSADEREKRMYMFNAPDSPYFIFLLSTRAGGLGLNLATADTVIIFDSDWNPMMDLQAQDRAHRIGQRKDVRVFRIITQTPVEEKILSRATEKLQMNELVVEAGKFDKSGQAKEDNSLERLKMMELLLTDFDETQNTQGTATAEANFESTDTDDGDADEEQEDSKNLFNEMICTNDDDYKMYCKMDLERTNAPELYTDINTAPDWVRYPGGKPKEGEEFIDPSQPEILGKRRAAAGDIKYDDGLTEKQFCRMMDKKHIADEKAMKKKAKGKKRNHKDLDVDPSLILDYDGGGRKRSKAEQFEVDTSSARSKPVLGKGGNSDEVTPAIQERLYSVTKSVIYFKDKATNRKLSEIFLERPCPQTYPDYYQIIEKPIGMNDILRKCRAKLYTSMKDFREDWDNLFKNALTYNGAGSWIVADADTLKGEYDKLMDKNMLSKAAAASKKPVRIKLSLKGGKKKKGKTES